MNGSNPLLHPLLPPNRPEVIGQVPIRQVIIRHGEIPLHPPLGPPRVAEDESFGRVVVADRQHRMTAYHPFARLRHTDDPALGYLLRLEAFVNFERDRPLDTFRA